MEKPLIERSVYVSFINYLLSEGVTITASGGDTSEVNELVADNLLLPDLIPFWRGVPDDNATVSSRVPLTLEIDFGSQKWFNFLWLDRRHNLTTNNEVIFNFSNVSSETGDIEETIPLTGSNGYVNAGKSIPYRFAEFQSYRYARIEFFDLGVTAALFQDIYWLTIGVAEFPTKSLESVNSYSDVAFGPDNVSMRRTVKTVLQTDNSREYSGSFRALDQKLDIALFDRLADSSRTGKPFVFCYDYGLDSINGEVNPGAREQEHSRLGQWLNAKENERQLAGLKTISNDSEKWDLRFRFAELATLATAYVQPDFDPDPSERQSDLPGLFFLDEQDATQVTKKATTASPDDPQISGTRIDLPYAITAVSSVVEEWVSPVGYLSQGQWVGGSYYVYVYCLADVAAFLAVRMVGTGVDITSAEQSVTLDSSLLTFQFEPLDMAIGAAEQLEFELKARTATGSGNITIQVEGLDV